MSGKTLVNATIEVDYPEVTCIDGNVSVFASVLSNILKQYCNEAGHTGNFILKFVLG